MRPLELLMLLLPIIFMIHEYEEIIFVQAWTRQHRAQLRRRFPRVELFLSRQGLFECSTATFAASTAYEFLLLSGITFFAVAQELYTWWFACFVGHTFHLLLHLMQGLFYRRYLPFLLTSLLSIPYCIYTFISFQKAHLLSVKQMLLWAGVGIGMMAIVLFSALFLLRKLRSIV